MSNEEFLYELGALKSKLCAIYRADEETCVDYLLDNQDLDTKSLENIHDLARKLVIAVRKRRLGKGGLDAFLFEYDLSSDEGIALMCLSEALLRVPDPITRDNLIKDKILSGKWEDHIGKSQSTFVNAATWGLMLTGKFLTPAEASSENLANSLQRLTKRSGEAIVRKAIGQSMKILGRQFVMGQKIEDAIDRAKYLEKKGFTYSYDMLGEAACCMQDADQYMAAYEAAINAIGKSCLNKNLHESPAISVKLSGLHPRYEWRHKKRVFKELLPRVVELACLAKEYNIGLTIDAEESSRLLLSLELFDKLLADKNLESWDGLGLAIQAYQKRAPYVIDYVVDSARRNNRKITIRLVKGAYWDTEIKIAQELGLSGYPVYTRKATTDVSYQVCVKKLFAASDTVYSQFATHNAYTVALVMEYAGQNRNFEFQCLHGMGDALYTGIVGNKDFNVPCRIYAPVGGYKDLLAYLVRRLLENGANTSFVNRIIDERAPVEDLIVSPVKKLLSFENKNHPMIPLPENLFAGDRDNSKGLDLNNPLEYANILRSLNQDYTTNKISLSETNNFQEIITSADNVAKKWSKVDPEDRAKCLLRMAELLENNKAELFNLLAYESGKVLSDSIAEVREAIDFCNYYAHRALIDLVPTILPGPTGETNNLHFVGRGIVVCISPWNFPLAIFLGQVTAALVAGNTVITKPAGQTPKIAARAVELLYEAGIPKDALHLVITSGRNMSEHIIADERTSAVMFTGSTETAKTINNVLANRSSQIVPFIAETGGQNAMIVDSSALSEQVILDAITSAFGSAGQRCSALRVLFLQEDIADGMIAQLAGAMAEIKVGPPEELSTDVGPVIDQASLDTLQAHQEFLDRTAKLIYAVKLPDNLPDRPYFAPCAYEIGCISELEKEVFGPILHVVRYKASELGSIIEKINATGYGLTLGIHSRIDNTVDFIFARAKVGNIYVNRNMIGAVVGVQPFGGEGLSGTGPKAGGPHYLSRLTTERTISVNTAAAGGNATLMALQE